MGTHFSTAQELPRHDEATERRMRMRALHARHRSRRPRGPLQEGVQLGLYLLRLTVHALGFGLILAGFLAVLYFLG